MEFIATLPFKATARMIIMYDPQGRAVTAIATTSATIFATSSSGSARTSGSRSTC
jgi:hypothetical protein